MTDLLTEPRRKAQQHDYVSRSRLSARAPFVVFAGIEIVAFPLMLWLDRGTWFQLDDWDFLAARTGGNVGDLFRGHNDHWTTLPIVAYRLMWQVFGLHSARPYQALVVLGHLGVAALLLGVMRRLGVGPWLATGAATLLVFFGAGAENILVAFQITFVYAFAFGLVHLLCADHDGPFDRRDWFGLLAGVASLMCSGVGVAMAIVVGYATLLRRGWRIALAHTAPLAAIYLLWRSLAPAESAPSYYRANSVGGILRFVAVGFRATLRALGQLPGVGVLLALLIVVGLYLGVRDEGRRFAARTATAIALLAGAATFLVITAMYRSGAASGLPITDADLGPEHARISRYVYIVGAMLLPVLALTAQLVLRRWRAAAIVVVALLLIGLPGNIDKLVRYNDLNRSAFVRARRPYVLTAARLPLARDLPPSLPLSDYLTIGWLVDSVPSGRIPPPPNPSPVAFSNETLGLALAPSPPTDTNGCVTLRAPVIRVLQKGEHLTVRGGDASVVYVPYAAAQSDPRRLPPATYVALAGPLRVRITPARGAVPPDLCASA